jgi:hypothetical protein
MIIGSQLSAVSFQQSASEVVCFFGYFGHAKSAIGESPS